VTGTPTLSVATWLAAAAPIIVLLILMIGFSWSGARAGAAAWITALIVSLAVFGGNERLIAFANGKAILLSIWVLYIIWSALLLFHVVNEAGAIKTIGDGLSLVTTNRTMQLLLLAWAFTSFLQGIAGYGVPVAVVAPLLVGLGFTPILSVVVTSIGHSWAVTFGSLAASFIAMEGVTGIAGSHLAGPAALMLGLAGYFCGFALTWAYGGWRTMVKATPMILTLGTVMGGTEWFMAVHGYYSLASFTAGLVGLAVGIGISRLPMLRREPVFAGEAPPVMGGSQEATPRLRDLGVALSPYVVLIVIVLAASLITPLTHALDAVELNIAFPATHTSFGWTNKATASYRSISVFGHAGALLLYTAIIGYLIYRFTGKLGPGALRQVGKKTLAGAVPSSLGIITLVAMALVMMESGMTFQLAQGISKAARDSFPILAPFIGVLGCFMTGSNTNSNILFGALQRDTSQLLGLPATIILAAQTTGGALGGIIAPAKLIVGCSTVGLNGQEGPVIRAGVKWGLMITLLIGIATFVAVQIGL